MNKNKHKTIQIMIDSLKVTIEKLEQVSIADDVILDCYYCNDECEWWIEWHSPRDYDGDWFSSFGELVDHFLDNLPT